MKFVKFPKNNTVVIGTHISTGLQIYYRTARESMKDGFNPSSVSRCIHGKQAEHGEYTWNRAVAGVSYKIDMTKVVKRESNQAERYVRLGWGK